MMVPNLTAHEALKVQRERLGVTQIDAADRCGIERRLWIAIEKGRAIPPSQSWVVIEREFGIPASAWIEQSAPAALAS